MAEPFNPYLHWLGLRDTERPPNHYRLLGVGLFEDDPEVLSNAADRQMAHVRTFQTGKHSAESQKVLNELASAKVCLLNPAKKAAYDAQLQAAQTRKAPSVARPVGLPQPPTKPAAPSSSPPAGAPDRSLGPPVAVLAQPTRTTRRRPWTLVAAASLLGVVALAVWAIIVAGSGGNKPEDKNKGGEVVVAPPKRVDQPKPKPPVKSVPKPPKPEPKVEPKPPVKAVAKPEPKLPVAAPAPPRKPEPSTTGPSAFSQSLGNTRDAMRRRDMTAAAHHLDLAKKAARPEDAAEVERVGAVCDRLTQFWNAVREGKLDLKVGSVLQADGHTWKLRKVSGAKMVFGDGATRLEGTANTVPVSMAIAIAEPRLPVSPQEAALCKAAALVFDPSGDRAEAKRLCQALSDDDPVVQALWAELNAGATAANVPKPAQPFDSPKPGEDKRIAVPAEEAQQKARQEIREVFKERYAAAKDPDQQRKLARSLRQQATETHDNPVTRYMLYLEARDTAVVAGDTELVPELLAALAREYRVDGNALAAETLKAAAKKSRGKEAHWAFGRLALVMAENAAGSEDFESARLLIAAGKELARKAADFGGLKRADALTKDFSEREKLKARFPEIERTLAEKPDDVDANRDAARYYCLVKNDWRRGLPFAAKIGDTAIRDASNWELAHPSDSPAGMVALGDHWYDAVKTAEEPSRRLARLRAIQWYRRALTGLAGFSQARVQRRLDELGE